MTEKRTNQSDTDDGDATRTDGGGGFEATRRSFLAGGGALASGMALGGGAFGVLDGDERHVPDEPKKDGKVRKFTVHAIEVDIPYNQFGLHQPRGVMYVLDEDLEAARKASGTFPNDAFEAVDGDEQRLDFYSGSDAKEQCEDTAHIDIDGHKHHQHPKGADHDHHHPDGTDQHHRHRKDGGHDHERGSHHHGGDDHPAGDPHDDGIDTSVLRPLVIRANEGDIVEIEFINHLDRRASMHQVGLPYDVKESDGANVGYNPDTTVAPGESITYRWFAAHQGGHFFYDLANPAYDSAEQPPEEVNLLSKSLFGTMMVEPAGATWTDPFTGGELRSGVQADIHDPEMLGTSYREIVVHYHTPEGLKPDLTYPNSDEPQNVHAINYRADPTAQRADPDRAEELGVEPDALEEFFYNSWLNGDPGGGDNTYPVYKGDPIKFVAVGASIEENHVHHLHAHRWKTIPNRSDSDTIDSQTVGLGASFPVYFVVAHGEAQGSEASGPSETVRPEMTFEEAFEIGAGGAHGTAGDVLFHCHLFPHYGEGMWGSLRIFDKEQCGLQPLPNTTIADDPVPDEVPFPRGILPEDSPIPGFPDFIPNEVGSPPPESPGATGPNPPETGRQPTPEEEEALGEIVPGAPYVDPCDPWLDNTEFGGPPAGKDAPVKEYTIVALPADIVYNDNGDHDPDGIVYALEEDAEAIRNGEMNPEPLFIRANVGDCVELTLKNETERAMSIHPHFVSYDLLGSDSLANGYNYEQYTEPGEQRAYRWYADEEGPIYFHDHIFGIDDVMHGEFCALIVEPQGSEYLDPYSGEPIRSGSQAIIKTPEGKNDFREFALHLHDFAQLVKRNGEFVNPDVQHNENAGTMAINYRNAPLYQRNDPDAAYAYSSAVHGDPPTPLLEAYSNDPIRIRVIQGAWEEQHNFLLHGRPFESEGLDIQDAVSEHIGTSEQFTFLIDPDEESGQDFERMDNPFGLPVRDHLYGTGIIDDRWTGMWGIHRVFDAETPHLAPLPDRGPPKGKKITKRDLERMGHFAPFLGLERLERLGRDALLLYDEDDNRCFPPDKDARQNRNVGEVPPQAPDPGDPCPDDAPVRQIDVTAFRTEIEFNEYGDHDPFGIVYALDEHVEDVKCGDRPAEPLAIRANRGDCVEINLTNGLPGDVEDVEDVEDELRDLLDDLLGDVDVRHDELRKKLEAAIEDGLTRSEVGRIVEEFLDDLDDDLVERIKALVRDLLERLRDPDDGVEDHAHPKMRVSQPWDASDRISLHPTRITYDVTASDGATVGFNFDQTVAPGETITYRWYAEEVPSNVALWDEADVRSHRHHGAFGTLIVEPRNATWLDPNTAEPLLAGSEAMIATPNGTDTREFTLSFSDGRYIVNENDPDDCVVPVNLDDPEQDPNAPCNQIGDPEDQGYVAINNRAEPFIRRFQTGPDDQHLVFDSETHGDPATPIPEALLGDPIKFLVQKSSDKSRGMTFHLASHQWRRFRGIPESPIIGADDRFEVGKAEDLDLVSDAGGLAESTGDFLYAELKERRRLEAGFWGIFRVREDPGDFETPMQPLPAMAKKMGLTPDERPGWNVLRTDLTGSGREDLVVGVPRSDLAGVDAGAVYVFENGADRNVTDLSTADGVFVGEPGERAGISLATDESSEGEGALAALVVETEGDTTYTVPAGGELREALADVPWGRLATTLTGATNTSIDVVAGLRDVSA
ncbi:multicopper oxidase domain-containing protein [Halomarina pelagica]|uniref:multicopper oxidase domain-containing protein n=1 Tax=Halomarina pelagica TaxID=2961599 RepID=UPI0020C33BCF|nr:multicopper oxidase domain-containing protein [Halomarina sp. BND7]